MRILAELAAILGGVATFSSLLVRHLMAKRRARRGGKLPGESHEEYVARKQLENAELEKLRQEIELKEEK